MLLPADSHVHTQWSWDAPNGDMAGSCARAVELGLPAIAFTEHLDHTVWQVAPDDRGGYAEPPGLLEHRGPADVLRSYLAEVTALVTESDAFGVLAHVDYPVRSWPAAGDAFTPEDFEEEFRHTLRATAQSGRALELSTVVPLHATIVRWWREEGGDAITFGSDAHDPTTVARGFRDAVHMAEAHGFRPGERPHDLWGRA